MRMRPSSLTLLHGRILPDFSWLLKPARTVGSVLVDASDDGEGSQSMPEARLDEGDTAELSELARGGGANMDMRGRGGGEPGRGRPRSMLRQAGPSGEVWASSGGAADELRQAGAKTGGGGEEAGGGTGRARNDGHDLDADRQDRTETTGKDERATVARQEEGRERLAVACQGR